MADIERIDSEALNNFLSKKHGKNWYKLEQETLMSDCKDSFLANKINAMKTYLLNNSFFFDENVFEKMVLAMNSKYVDFEIDQDIDLEDIILAITDLKKIEDRKAEFCNEIKARIAIEASSEGYIVLRNELEFAQPMLDILNKFPSEAFKEKIAKLSEGTEFEELADKNDKYSIQAKKIIYSKMITKIKERFEVE